MKSVLICTFAVATGVAAFLYADQTKAPTTKPAGAVAVNKYCATEGEPHPIDAAVTSDYEGKTYGFCCADCITEFKKDPAKYAAKAK